MNQRSNAYNNDLETPVTVLEADWLLGVNEFACETL